MSRQTLVGTEAVTVDRLPPDPNNAGDNAGHIGPEQVVPGTPSEQRRPPVPLGRPPDVAELDDRPTIVEQDLLARFRQGDETAFAQLFELHWKGVLRLLARLLGDVDVAGDLAQEVFVQLYRRPPDGEGAPLRAWLYRVALNRGYNELRRERRRRNREAVAAGDPSARPAVETLLTEAANQAEERDAVRRTLMRLNERQRDCLVLRSEGLSYAEMAVALGVAPASVGTLLARAERAFKEAYLAQRGGL